MTPTLRAYQTAAVDAVLSDWQRHRSTIVVMATGLGKTITAAEVIRQRRHIGRTLWLAHREELVQQAADTLDSLGLTVEIEKADHFASHDGGLFGSRSDVVVASVQSMHRRRRGRFGSDGFVTVIADECFPAGTMIGSKRIEDLRAGDMVPSYDERSGRVCLGRVVAQWSRTPVSVVRVHTEAGPIVCTPNHPLLTRRGWVPAGQLHSEDEVRHEEQLPQGMRSVRRGQRHESVEGRPARFARVDRVEVLEPGRDRTFGGVCPDGRVYNLEVEGTHTYVANGFVAHNCHHSPARTWRGVIDYFADAKVLGLTATPDRGDEVGLGNVFDSVAYERDIRTGIREAWLVPVRQRRIECADLDISDLRTVRGDLAQGELEQRLTVEGVLHQIAGPLVQEAGDRPTLVFTSGVAQAHALAAVMGEGYCESHRAVAMDGSTSPEERAMQVERFKDGRLQYLINCGLFLEGFDARNAACIAVARPTKSRALYTQAVGRGTRTLPGVVEGVDSAEDRVHAIADSDKPDCVVLDFVGNAGRHKLVTPADVLGGKRLPEDVVAAANKIAADGDVPVEEALQRAEAAKERSRQREEAERQRRERAAQVRADVTYIAEDVDPFTITTRERGPRASDKQIAELKRLGYRVDTKPSRREASEVIGPQHDRLNAGLCTVKQARVLARAGLRYEDISRKDASWAIDRLSANRWKPTPEVIARFGRDYAEAAE